MNIENIFCNYEQKYIYTQWAKDTYGKKEVIIPEGYEFLDFRLSKSTDSYILGEDGCVHSGENLFTSPRIILKKKTKPRMWLVTEDSTKGSRTFFDGEHHHIVSIKEVTEFL